MDKKLIETEMNVVSFKTNISANYTYFNQINFSHKIIREKNYEKFCIVKVHKILFGQKMAKPNSVYFV